MPEDHEYFESMYASHLHSHTLPSDVSIVAVSMLVLVSHMECIRVWWLDRPDLWMLSCHFLDYDGCKSKLSVIISMTAPLCFGFHIHICACASPWRLDYVHVSWLCASCQGTRIHTNLWDFTATMDVHMHACSDWLNVYTRIYACVCVCLHVILSSQQGYLKALKTIHTFWIYSRTI